MLCLLHIFIMTYPVHMHTEGLLSYNRYQITLLSLPHPLFLYRQKQRLEEQDKKGRRSDTTVSQMLRRYYGNNLSSCLLI